MNETLCKQYHGLNKLISISLAFILLMLFSQTLLAKNVSVKTDRLEIEMGDIITLVVQTDFQTFDTPDLTVLQDQFELLGQQTSGQVSMVNGQFQMLSRWYISLTPKQAGTLIIPSLSVAGINSQPLTLKVKPFQPNQQHRGSSFLEASVENQQAYVQQQVIFTLRFYFQGQLIDGNIRSPQLGNALFEPLYNKVNYQKRIGNQLYEVLEWRWAFYPQQSGDMAIPPQRFDGRQQYRGQIKRIEDTSQPISLQILPKPQNYPADQLWLPATKLTLSEQWQSKSEIRVGESIARQILLKAEGLLASQLPKLTQNGGRTYQVYPGQANQQNRKSRLGFISEKVQELAIIPTQVGTLTIPQFRLPWWNLQTDKMEELVLPAKTLKVLPAMHQQILPQIPPPVKVSHETSVSTPIIWQWLTGLFACLWLVTLMAFWYQKKHGRQSTNTQSKVIDNSTPVTVNELPQLCNITDPKTFYQALNHYLTRQRIKPSEELAALIERLTRHLFRQQPLEPGTLTEICHLLKQPQKTQATGKQLIELYPR